jgi:UDP:flavonoid glycosyltransferase YjiC (YdhE family)
MSRIVLTTIGSLGDLHPFIAIGLGLRDRGHNIVFATVKDYRAKVESLGFEFHSIRPDHIAMDDPKMLSLMMDLQKGTERVIRDYLLANLRQTYADLTTKLILFSTTALAKLSFCQDSSIHMGQPFP